MDVWHMCRAMRATETETIPITMGTNRNQSASHISYFAHCLLPKKTNEKKDRKKTRTALINSIYRRKCVTEIHCEDCFGEDFLACSPLVDDLNCRTRAWPSTNKAI